MTGLTEQEDRLRWMGDVSPLVTVLPCAHGMTRRDDWVVTAMLTGGGWSCLRRRGQGSPCHDSIRPYDMFEATVERQRRAARRLAVIDSQKPAAATTASTPACQDGRAAPT